MTHRKAVSPALMNADLKISKNLPLHHTTLILSWVEDLQVPFHPEIHHLNPSSEIKCRGSSCVLLQIRGYHMMEN